MATITSYDTVDEVDSGNLQTTADDVDHNAISPVPDDQDSSVYPDQMATEFDKKTWREDMALVVEGRKLYVASNILSLMSPVFTTMFEEQFTEERPREVELTSKKVDDVVMFLRCLYPNIEQIVTMNNVFAVLPLAVEFEVGQLKRACEDVLIEATNESTIASDVCRYVHVGLIYKMQRLRAKCVKSAATLDTDVLSEAEKLHPLSPENKLDILSCQNDLLTGIITKMRLVKQKDDETLQTFKQYMAHSWGETDVDFQNAEAGALKLKIMDVCDFNEARSRHTCIMGIDFHINAYKTEDDDLSVFIEIKAPADWYWWSCEAKAKIMLLNEDACKHHAKGDNIRPNSSKLRFGYKRFISFDKLTSTEGFVVDDVAEINVYLLVKQPMCKPKPPLPAPAIDLGNIKTEIAFTD